MYRSRISIATIFQNSHKAHGINFFLQGNIECEIHPHNNFPCHHKNAIKIEMKNFHNSQPHHHHTSQNEFIHVNDYYIITQYSSIYVARAKNYL